MTNPCPTPEEVPSPRDEAEPWPHYQPVAIDLSDLSCLVVGGGKVGTHKALLLAKAGARVTVVSPEISPTLRESLNAGGIHWIQARFSESVLEGKRLVVAASDDKAVNLQIAQAAERHGILCCNVSAAETSRVIFPAVCHADGLTVAIHSDGRHCRKSQAMRDKIATWLAVASDKESP